MTRPLRALAAIALVAFPVGCGKQPESSPSNATDDPPATNVVENGSGPVDEPSDPVVPADPPSDPPTPVVGEVFRRSDNRPQLDVARLAKLGIHRYASQRLVLYTDIEPELARTLPPLIDAAYGQWVAYFGELPPDRERSEFQITGYLMQDAVRFEDAGLVPRDLPRFLNGRHRDYEFWMYDQEQAYYRRHLLLHEATHCFTTSLPNVRLPIWYLEGIAELFATHSTVKGRGSRVEGQSGDAQPSTLNPQPLRLRVMPFDKEHFEGLGRITLIQEAVADERLLTLAEVDRLAPDAYLKPDAYAWAWAAAKFLDAHPDYAERFRRVGRRAVVDAVPFETAFAEAFADDRANIDVEWPAFVSGLCTGYDLERAAVTFAPGRPSIGATVDVRADRGWQSTAMLVEQGTRYEITATGAVTLADDPKPWVSEANGISIRYVDGHRLGRLFAAVVPTDPTTRPHALLETTPLGNTGHFEPKVTGTLYLRLNDDWSELSDNAGEIEVSIRPVR